MGTELDLEAKTEVLEWKNFGIGEGLGSLAAISIIFFWDLIDVSFFF